MIRGSAQLINGSTGRAAATRMVEAKASAIDAIKATAIDVLSPLRGYAERTWQTGLMTYLRVLPEQPQELVWLTPQVGIDYEIQTSNNLEWIIK